MACECDMRLKSILAEHQQQQHQDEGARIMALVESAVVRNHHTTDLFRRRRHRCDQRVAGLINPLVARSGIGLHRNVFSQLSFQKN